MLYANPNDWQMDNFNNPRSRIVMDKRIFCGFQNDQLEEIVEEYWNDLRMLVKLEHELKNRRRQRVVKLLERVEQRIMELKFWPY